VYPRITQPVAASDLRPDYSKQQAVPQSVGGMMPPEAKP